MKYIKTFEQLINESKRFKEVDSITLDWCNDKITESEFFSYIEQLSVNEGWFESAKEWLMNAAKATVDWFKEKFFKILLTMLKTAFEVGMSIINKVMQFVTWIFEKLNNFADKHPILWKVILVTLIIFICLVVCASTAKAQVTGQPIDTDVINSAIGMLKSRMGSAGDSHLYSKAMAYLVDIRDGHQDIDPQVIGKGAMELGKSAISTIENYKKSSDSNFIQYAADSIAEGAKILGAEIVKIKTFTGSEEKVIFH